MQPQRHIASINSRSANSLQAMPRRNRACPSRLGTAACWLAVLLALPAFCPAATNSWIGLGASGNWSDGSNWGTTAPPGTGDTIVFPAGAARPVNTNNLSGTLILSQMQFRGSNYVLYGNALSVTNSIVATNLSGANAINNAITLATADVTMLVSAGTLALNGQLSGSVGVTKTGAGTLLYQYGLNNTYSGSTRVNAGTLQLNVLGTSSFGGPLIIGDGSGTGSPIVQALIGSVISDSASVTVNRGGILDLNRQPDAQRRHRHESRHGDTFAGRQFLTDRGHGRLGHIRPVQHRGGRLRLVGHQPGLDQHLCQRRRHG